MAVTDGRPPTWPHPMPVPDELRLKGRGVRSLAAGIEGDVARDTAMRNASLRAAGQTSTR